MSATWVPVADGSDFPLENLPYGVFTDGDEAPRVGVAIGEHVLDVSRLDVPHASDLERPSLNAFMARGRSAWEALRSSLTAALTEPRQQPRVEPHLIPMNRVSMGMPFEVADYVDFYSSEHHAANVGRIFRPSGDPLTPNWRHLPIAYHGRAGTVVVSGTPVTRPSGQRLDGGAPVFGPSTRLDIEAEIGFVVGVPSAHGTPVGTADFDQHVFGVVLVNDWSARDIQAWEYVPLGPFLGKSFATTISAWVVPLAALEPFRLAPPQQVPPPLPYLRAGEPWGLDITLEVEWNGTVVSRPPAGGLYWTGPQQLAHLTSNGASLRTGDLFASGTISGEARDQRGSLLELTWNGAEPVTLGGGATRAFLEDGDLVAIRARAGGRLGWGDLTGTVVPGKPSG
jgi:fumarylacetoacetase